MGKSNNYKEKIISLLLILFVCSFTLDPFNIFDKLSVAASLLLVIILCAIQYRKELFKSMGFTKANFNVKNLLVFAPIVAIILLVIYVAILIPIVESITSQPQDLELFKALKGNTGMLVVTLIYVWISAALGEEIIFRGYLMRQFIRVFGDNKISLILNIAIFSIFFGALHSYQGPTGQILAGLTGATFATIFAYKKYDLWFNVFIHGFFDTFAILAFYMGWFN